MFLRSRRWFVAAALVIAGVASAPGMASASLVLNMNGQTGEFSQSGSTFDGNILATFADTGVDQVTLTLDMTGVSGPAGLKVGSFYFNIAGFNPNDVLATGGSPNDVSFFTFNKGVDAFKADGDGFFDFVLGFPSNASGALTLGEIATIVLSGPSGLTSSAFSDISVNGNDPNKNGFYAAAHVQAIDGGSGSGWFKGEPVTVSAVPEPSTLVSASLGAGMLGLVALRRRKASKVA